MKPPLEKRPQSGQSFNVRHWDVKCQVSCISKREFLDLGKKTAKQHSRIVHPQAGSRAATKVALKSAPPIGWIFALHITTTTLGGFALFPCYHSSLPPPAFVCKSSFDFIFLLHRNFHSRGNRMRELHSEGRLGDGKIHKINVYPHPSRNGSPNRVSSLHMLRRK